LSVKKSHVVAPGDHSFGAIAAEVPGREIEKEDGAAFRVRN
jgi:hypothetical protein